MPSYGGRDEETLDEAKQRGARQRSGAACRAVTGGRLRVPRDAGRRTSRRAKALPLYHPGLPGRPGARRRHRRRRARLRRAEPDAERGHAAHGVRLPRPAPAAHDRAVRRRRPTLPAGQVTVDAHRRRQRRPRRRAARRRRRRCSTTSIPLRGGEDGQRLAVRRHRSPFSRVFQRVLAVPGVDAIERLVITLDGEEAPECRDVPIRRGRARSTRRRTRSRSATRWRGAGHERPRSCRRSRGRRTTRRRCCCDARVGWPVARLGSDRDRPAAHLTLERRPGSLRWLTEPSGSFGGLRPPANVAVRGRRRLAARPASSRRSCASIRAPARSSRSPASAAKATALGSCATRRDRRVRPPPVRLRHRQPRVGVFVLPTLAVAGHWAPAPPGPPTWQPTGVVVDQRARPRRRPAERDGAPVLAVRHATSGTATASAPSEWLAIDRERNHLRRRSASRRSVSTPDGSAVARHRTRRRPRRELPAPPFEVDRRRQPASRARAACRRRRSCSTVVARHDPSTPAHDVARFERAGTATIGPLDSWIDSCTWHRIILRGELPDGCRVAVTTLHLRDRAAPIRDRRARRRTRGTPRLECTSFDGDPWDGLVRGEPGRYLWLRLELAGQRTCDAAAREHRDRVPPDQPAPLPAGGVRRRADERRLHRSPARALRPVAPRHRARRRPARRASSTRGRRRALDVARVVDRPRARPPGARRAAARRCWRAGREIADAARHALRTLAPARRVPRPRRRSLDTLPVRGRPGLRAGRPRRRARRPRRTGGRGSRRR